MFNRRRRRILESQDGKTKHQFDSKITAKCPCGGEFSAGYIDSSPCVTHTMPPCAKFVDLEADAYLAYVNNSRLS